MEIKVFTNKKLYHTNSFIITSDKKAILIDCSNQAEEILNYLLANELELTDILLTHGNYNHLMGIEVIKTHFPKANVLIGEKDIICLYDSRANLSLKTGDNWFLKRELDRIIPIRKDALININGLEFKMVLVGGYTKGSLIFQLIEQNKIFSGDNIYAHAIGNYWTTFKRITNRKLKKAIRFIYKSFTDECQIFPGHGKAGFTLSEVKKNNLEANKIAKYQA